MSIHLSTFVIMIVSFGLLYYLLQKYAFGPLFSVMEKRREYISEQIGSAEQSRQESDKLLADQKQALIQVRNEAAQILEQARATSAKQAEEIIAQAKSEAVRLKEEAVRDIESESKKAQAALRAEVQQLSVLVASKILGKQIDEKSQSELIEKALKEVGGAQ